MPRPKALIAASLATLSLVAGAGHAGAQPDGRNPNAAANCTRVWERQDANGQTGDLTGGADDPKLFPSAVTNCAHFWLSIRDIDHD